MRRSLLILNLCCIGFNLDEQPEDAVIPKAVSTYASRIDLAEMFVEPVMISSSLYELCFLNYYGWPEWVLEIIDEICFQMICDGSIGIKMDGISQTKDRVTN